MTQEDLVTKSKALDKVRHSEVAYIDSASRTKIVKLHISLTFVYRVFAVGLNFLLVPLTINYLNIERYGIWMTLLSIVSWFAFFDIGLGHGLRNKLTEALSMNNITLAKTYISTAYIVISVIALLFFLVLLSISPFVEWNKIFNTSISNNHELSAVVLVTGFFFLLNFVLSLCNPMFYAFQEASLSSLGLILQNALAVIFIYLLIHYSHGSLLHLSIAYGLTMVLSNVLLIYYFLKKHNEINFSIRYIDFSKIKGIISLGTKFFIIQIAVLVIFATDNIIITQLFGPAEVTPYNVVFKLFSIITFGHSIIISPLWSAYTDAYTKGDINWIKGVLRKLNLLLIPIIISVVILVIFARDIINLWVGPDIKFPSLLLILMGIYTIISVWNNIYAYFINGIGKIKPQLYSSILAAIINIPLSIYFAKHLSLGISGVILGTIFSLSLFAIVGPFQTISILKSKVIHVRV